MLEDAVHLLGADLRECGRLFALPYMLRRGRLRKIFGGDACDSLTLIAESIPVIVQPGNSWLDRLTSIDSIDPGEAQIFAAAAEFGMIVVSDDKRALLALKNVGDFPDALAGRIVILEAILIALCNRLGPNEVRRRVKPLMDGDKLVRICFSDSVPDPRDGLRSYFNSQVGDLNPLILWNPE